MKNKISKKTFYWIFSICIIVALVVFELFMYFYFGIDVLLQKGIVRTLWILVPILIISLSFVRDIIIKKLYN